MHDISSIGLHCSALLYLHTDHMCKRRHASSLAYIKHKQKHVWTIFVPIHIFNIGGGKYDEVWSRLVCIIYLPIQRRRRRSAHIYDLTTWRSRSIMMRARIEVACVVVATQVYTYNKSVSFAIRRHQNKTKM